MDFLGLPLKALLLVVLALQLLSFSHALPGLSVRQDDDRCQINSICFVMDRSGSIGSNYPTEQSFVVAVSRDLATRMVDTSYSAYGFASSASEIQSSTQDLEGVFIPKVNEPVVVGGGTNMYAGLNACFQEIKDMSGNRVIVLITDGRDNNTPRASELAVTVKASGVAIVTVGIGSNVDEGNLETIASDPSLFIPSSFSSLPGDVVKVADSTCDSTTMVTPPPSVSPTPTVDICEEAYQACDFQFRGIPTVPTFRLRKRNDRPFTRKIVSRVPGERLGVLNTNGIVPQFIDDASVQEISEDSDASPRFTPTHFKPFKIKGVMGSGIGHQTFTGNQLRIARNRCIRVYFSQYQILTDTKPRNVKDNLNFPIKSTKCIVFRTM